MFQTSCDILVIFVSTYVMSPFFFMTPQTRQFPTMLATTSMECTVAMAMPDDWGMTECCPCYTVGRPFRFNEKINKNELVNGKRKQKCQSLMWEIFDVRWIFRHLMFLSTNKIRGNIVPSLVKVHYIVFVSVTETHLFQNACRRFVRECKSSTSSQLAIE